MLLLFPPPALDLRFFEESALLPVVVAGVGCVCWVVAPPPPPSSLSSSAFFARFAAWLKIGKRDFLSAIFQTSNWKRGVPHSTREETHASSGCRELSLLVI